MGLYLIVGAASNVGTMPAEGNRQATPFDSGKIFCVKAKPEARPQTADNKSAGNEVKMVKTTGSIARMLLDAMTADGEWIMADLSLDVKPGGRGRDAQVICEDAEYFGPFSDYEQTLGTGLYKVPVPGPTGTQPQLRPAAAPAPAKP